MNSLHVKRLLLGWVLRARQGDAGGDSGGVGDGSNAGMGGASTSSRGGNQPMGPDGPGFGTAADNAAALAAGAAMGGYSAESLAGASTTATPIPPTQVEPHPDRNTTGWASAGWSADTAEHKAKLEKLDRPSWYNSEDRGLAERVFDATNPDKNSKLFKYGHRGFGMSFGDVERQEAANPGMQSERVRLGMNGIMNVAKTFIPGMGVLNAGIAGANVANDVKNGVPLGDSLTRVVPGLIDSSLNRITAGALGKASLASGVVNEFKPSIPAVPSVGSAVWAGLGNKKPSTSIGPGIGNTVSGGEVSPSGMGYDTGGWSSGGSYRPAVDATPKPDDLIMPTPEPTPIPSTPLDTRLFRNKTRR